MSNRTRPILACLLCAAIISSSGCASTPKAAPSQTTKPVYTIAHDGNIEVQYVTEDVPQSRRKRPAWACKVARVLHASMAIYLNPNLAAVYVAEAMK